KLRYPVLWEIHQPNRQSKIIWNRSEFQLNKISNSGIEPIVGLLHHGSGPSFTNLADPNFPQRFAEYAFQVARKFPWIDYYTPINEPLTTARFSGLYGFWYPHHTNDFSFTRMFLNELKATILAWKAIKEVNPNAKLVQTEDLTYIHSTPTMKYQANFENHRRWLTWDILFGKFNPNHVMWQYFLDSGIKEKVLGFFSTNFSPPHIIGCNYYVTSERYLDEHLELFPSHAIGKNSFHQYVDVEAVRVKKMKGIKSLLRETWNRYQTPIAITECHLHCTREEQMRWLQEVWNSCTQLRLQNIDVKAVTAWSLLGAYDWNSLLTKNLGHYESGVFEISNKGKLRTTALCTLVKQFSKNKKFKHPLLNQAGWWAKEKTDKRKKQQPVLIIGKKGTLAFAFQQICNLRKIPYVALSQSEIDICSELSLSQHIDRIKPWAVINTSGFVKVDDAEGCHEKCFQINAFGPERLARICHLSGLQLMTFSTDMVFDGQKKIPYVESDPPFSLNVYGLSKREGEMRVSQMAKDALIIRTSSFFGPWDRYNFVFAVWEALRSNQIFRTVNDVFISPTYVPDLVHRSLDLLIDKSQGIWHIANDGSVSWFQLAQLVASFTKYSNYRIVPLSSKEMEWKARRPAYSVLDTERSRPLPSLENALQRYFREYSA
ncbi:MAG: dTDP-4-dehydrorhamnose reductase, partial [Bacteroidetes bacterium]